MAQTGFTPIQLYSTSTAAAAPVAGNLTNSTLGSELAINITDGKLFYKDNANAVQVIGWKTVPTTAGGTGLTTYTAGDLSYYASGTTFTKLAIGTNGQILTSTGTAPQWSTLSGVAVTTFSAGTTGFTPNSATSGAITLAGTLITSNGGTGLSSYTAGDLSYYASGTALTKLAIGTTGQILTSTGSAPQWSAPAALTETDDTNVTMTLGGTPSTALLSSVSMTLGWTGQLAVGRGGTGLATLATGRIPYGAGTSAFSSSANLTFNGTTLTTTALSVSTASAFAAISSTTTGNARYLLLNNSADNHNVYLFCSGLGGGFVQADANAGSFLYFSTQNIERMRVHGSGGVSIGNTTDPGATNLSVTGTIFSSKYEGVTGTSATLFNSNNASNTGFVVKFASAYTSLGNNFSAPLAFLTADTERMRITPTGEVLCGGTTDNGAYNLQCNGTGVWGAGAYVNGSDARIKDNIAPLDSGLDVVAKLNPVTYKYKETWSKDQSTQTGFVAQELLTALDGKNYVDGVVQQNSQYMSVAYQNIIPILTKAIQELNNKVISLEEKLKSSN